MNLLIPWLSRFFADRFKDLCVGLMGGSYYLGLQMLFAYFIFEYDSVSEMLRANSWTLSESQFLAMIAKFPANRLINRMRMSVLRKYKGELNPYDFIFAIDDTDNPKYARLASVSNWRGSKGKYRGQKIMVLALINVRSKIAIPLTYSLCLPKKHPDHINGPDLAVSLVEDVITFGFPRLPVACDSWFDSVEMATKLKEMKVTFVWELKANRNVKNNPGKFVKKKKMHEIFQYLTRLYVPNHCEGSDGKWIATTRIQLNKAKYLINGIAAYNRKNAREAFAFYGCTDLSVSGEWIWQMSRARWNIECLFRDLKQNLSFGRLPSSNDNASNLAVIVPFIIVTWLRIHPDKFGFEEGLSVGYMLKKLREEELDKNIELILKEPQSQKLANLRKRRERVTGKPHGTRCGRKMNAKSLENAA